MTVAFILYFAIVITHALTRVYAVPSVEVIEVKTIERNLMEIVTVQRDVQVDALKFSQHRYDKWFAEDIQRQIIEDEIRKLLKSIPYNLIEVQKIETRPHAYEPYEQYSLKLKILPPHGRLQNIPAPGAEDAQRAEGVFHHP